MGWTNPGATPPIDEAAYAQAHPYFAELCALSELRKRPGFGAAVQSGIGGHCLLYLNGVRLDRAAGYPVLQLCAPEQSPQRFGAGISVNSHYRNANWVGFEGADFVWRGLQKPGETLTRAAYQRTQEAAKANGMLAGVEFHPHLYRDKPSGMSDIDYMYEISVATDYAICFGRDTYRARVPLDVRRMGAIVDYLNALNTPYRDGKRIYKWRLFNDNCVHVSHNALAVAGVWAPWPTGQLAALAMFRFPVPKNAFVDLMLRTNDMNLADPAALFEDRAARRSFFENGVLPMAPGGLAIAGPSVADNEVYDTEKLRLIFYDNPFWGPYRFHFARIFSEPRYFDVESNLRHFAAEYERAAQASRRQVHRGAEQARFNAQYRRHIAAMREILRARLSEPSAGAENLAVALT